MLNFEKQFWIKWGANQKPPVLYIHNRLHNYSVARNRECVFIKNSLILQWLPYPNAMPDAQYIVDRLVQVKNGGRIWEWFVLSFLLFPAEGQKINSKWEAELNRPLSVCAWWGVSDGAFIGQAWKIAFPQRSNSPLSRNREIRLEILRTLLLSFLLPGSSLTR